MITETQLRHTALAASAATTELITRILAKYPQAKIRSSTVPLSDEDISLEVILPLPMSGIYVVRDWVYDLIIELQERYASSSLCPWFRQKGNQNSSMVFHKYLSNG